MKGNAYNWGSDAAQICLVAEAPGRVEVYRDEPLVGPSGHINDECLHAAGLIKRELKILNLMDSPIPSGDSLHTDGRVHADVQRHTERTIKAIQRTKARVIVTLGALPTAALLGKGHITKIRGSVYQCPFKKDAVIIPTIHPAATMRGTYLWRYLIQADYAKARRLSRTKGSLLPNPTLIINPSFNESVDFLQYVSTHKRAAYDVEIYNHQLSCLSFSVKEHEAISIPLVGEDGGHRWNIEQEMTIWGLVEKIVADPKIENIGQNILFDQWAFAFLNRIVAQGKTHDTMIAQHIMYPDFPKGLDFITSIRTDYEYYKDDRKLWSRIKEDPFTFWRYSAKDALVTYLSWLDIEEEMDDDYRGMHDFITAKYPALMHMMVRGIKVDRARLDLAREDVKARLARAEEKLEAIADYPFNPGSSVQCAKYFYEHKRIKPYTNRKTGRPTADDKAMQRLSSRHRLPEAALVQEIRGLRKLSGTYLEMELDKDDRFRSSYNPRGTSTMRLSSSKTVFGTGGNAQNLHPEFKHFLVPD